MAIRKIIEHISDRSRLAIVSLGFIFRKPKYICFFLFSFLLFLYIFTFFRDGSGNWQLLWSGLAFDRKLDLVVRVFTIIPNNFTSIYGTSLAFLSLFQAVVIMQLVFTWRHRDKDAVVDGASTGGVGAILGFIALGCPSCGIGLLAPLLSAIAGSTAAALAEGLSFIFSIAAFGLLLFTIIRLGYIDYVLISSKDYKEENAKSH